MGRCVTPMPQTSLFKAALANGDDTHTMVFAAVKHMPADEKARALTAVKTLPWEEWVNVYATCHHCGEKGHIRPMCPKYLAAIKSGKISPKNPRNFHDARKKPPGRPLPGKPGFRKQLPCDFKDPKAKAFLSAFQASFQALFAQDKEVSNDGDDDNDKGTTGADEFDVDDGDTDLHGFLTMVGSLKD